MCYFQVTYAQQKATVQRVAQLQYSVNKEIIWTVQEMMQHQTAYPVHLDFIVPEVVTRGLRVSVLQDGTALLVSTLHNQQSTTAH